MGMGMGLMRFGGVKHMAIMDYQPLPNDAPQIQDLYESELIRIREEIPSMCQPMSRRHFDDSSEERKYFSDVALKGNWTAAAANNNGDNDSDTDNDPSRESVRRMKELERAQREFVRGHVELTQRLLAGNNNEAATTVATKEIAIAT